jgi:hypothetical protein
MKKTQNNKHNTITPNSAQQAFDSIKPELDAVPDEDLVPINVDVPSACVTALGAADRLDTIGGQMVRLSGFDRNALEKLRVYGLAALYANAVATDDTGENLVMRLLTEATPLRGNLLVGAQALAHSGLLSAQRVAEIRAGQGHLDTADDLIALAALLDEAWAKVKDKTAVTREEVDRAAILGSELHVAVGARRVADGGRAKNGESQLARERAFTLLVRAYDECRRAASYLRWHEGDADEYAPSMYAKRKRRSARAEEPTTDLPIAPSEPVTTNPEPEAPTPAVE